MAKIASVFVCIECGYETKKWMGRCPGCHEWNTLEEEIKTRDTEPTSVGSVNVDVVPLHGALDEIEPRDASGIDELDRVLGGGFVKGSLVLVGGDPGIGKSTLLMQICGCKKMEGEFLYVTGEESISQIKIRASRLDLTNKNVHLIAQTDFLSLVPIIKQRKPRFLIIDSIQTMVNRDLTAAPGSVSQVKDITARLMDIGKNHGITVILVGHVTKDGAIAGPKVLEHMVDTVLYFEGERHLQYRILRAVKNRFGSTNEIGMFEMTQKGLLQVDNPSAIMLSGRASDQAGSVVVPSMEGTRPVLLEIQALAANTAFGMPRRMATGLDQNRVTMLLAVLEKKAGVALQNMDVYVNIAGGMKTNEPSCDLAVLAATASSVNGIHIPQDCCIMGEVGLTGEVRAIMGVERRLVECERMGFRSCYMPQHNKNLLDKKMNRQIECIGIDDVNTLMSKLFPF